MRRKLFDSPLKFCFSTMLTFLGPRLKTSQKLRCFNFDFFSLKKKLFILVESMTQTTTQPETAMPLGTLPLPASLQSELTHNQPPISASHHHCFHSLISCFTEPLGPYLQSTTWTQPSPFLFRFAVLVTRAPGIWFPAFFFFSS